jgi:prophage regulatory protein
VEQEFKSPDTIRRLPDVKRIVGLGHSTIYDMIAKGEFPKPVQLSARAVGWLESELTEWQRERIAKRSEKRAA